jgi:hypothetical protein
MILVPALALVSLMATTDFAFSTPNASVQLSVDFLPAFTGSTSRRPVLYSGSKEVQLPGPNAEMFVGAGALVRYTVEYAAAAGGRKGRGKSGRGTVRERVVLLDQSEGLPARADFHKKVPLVNGIASDLQLFGYDEATVVPAERTAARQQAKGLFRRFRQELFLDQETEPFAVLEWTHTITGIRVRQVSGSTNLARSGR